MEYVYDDGGRSQAGFKGLAGDCVARSVAIATGKPYKEIYDLLAEGTVGERRTKRSGGTKGRSARNGIHTTRKWFKDAMGSLGFRWIPTMRVGQGCTVHLADGELPMVGRLVVSVSKHYTALIDGVIRDTHDPQRQTYWYGHDGKTNRVSDRCVYGYWILE